MSKLKALAGLGIFVAVLVAVFSPKDPSLVGGVGPFLLIVFAAFIFFLVQSGEMIHSFFSNRKLPVPQQKPPMSGMEKKALLVCILLGAIMAYFFTRPLF